jgi:hypothetical protein
MITDKVVDLIHEKVKQTVLSEGFPVHMGTPYCKQFQANHSDCKGCESEQGCKRMTELGIAILSGILGDLTLEINVHQVNPNTILVCAPISPDRKVTLLKLLKECPELEESDWVFDQHKEPEKCETSGRWHYQLVKEA